MKNSISGKTRKFWKNLGLVGYRPYGGDHHGNRVVMQFRYVKIVGKVPWKFHHIEKLAKQCRKHYH